MIAGCKADVGHKTPRVRAAARAEALRLVTAAEATAVPNAGSQGNAAVQDSAGHFSLADLLVVSGVAVRGTVRRDAGGGNGSRGG